MGTLDAEIEGRGEGERKRRGRGITGEGRGEGGMGMTWVRISPLHPEHVQNVESLSPIQGIRRVGLGCGGQSHGQQVLFGLSGVWPTCFFFCLLALVALCPQNPVSLYHSLRPCSSHISSRDKLAKV